MKPTFEQAQEAAIIVRKYMHGEKICNDWCSKEADEIHHCSVILQEWTRDGQITSEVINKEFLEEYEYAHRISVDNFHSEEASVFGEV